MSGHLRLTSRVANAEKGRTAIGRCGSWGNLPVPPDPFHRSASRTGAFGAGRSRPGHLLAFSQMFHSDHNLPRTLRAASYAGVAAARTKEISLALVSKQKAE